MESLKIDRTDEEIIKGIDQDIEAYSAVILVQQAAIRSLKSQRNFLVPISKLPPEIML